MKKLYNKIIKSISKGLYESKLFNDDLLNTDELTLDELDIADNMNSYKFIDLGLPSGTLWCNKNIGAENPEDEGFYYQWGDTEPHVIPEFTPMSYKFNKGPRSFKKYSRADKKRILELTDDAAYNLLGNAMIPSLSQIHELAYKCNWKKNENSIIAIGPNNNSIVFPYIPLSYWSNELSSTFLYMTQGFDICDGSPRMMDINRAATCAIRPVKIKNYK